MSQSTVDQHSMAHLALWAEWDSAGVYHLDVCHFERFNVWRDLDLLPPEMHGEILGQEVGHRASHAFPAGELAPTWTTSRMHTVREDQFNRQYRPGIEVSPQRGRFYPQGIVRGAARDFDEALSPMRLIGMRDGRLSFDLNHPMARSGLELGVEIVAISPAPAERGGRCTDVVYELLQGPGMQARDERRATDFLSDDPFQVASEIVDRAFYAMPRLVNHLDARALDEVSRLYGSVLPAGGRVLDLMASWDSHLPPDLDTSAVTGLGLNMEELNANPRLDERVDHDLNQSPPLPFPDGHFDAVICTASVEYLTRPLDSFREVRRILRPGGVFVNSFSNRWFPGRAIDLWPDLHEFERLGLVTEYYLQAGGFEDLNTLSVRGLSRPEDDAHIGSTLWSDPVYAVWGSKQSV